MQTKKQIKEKKRIKNLIYAEKLKSIKSFTKLGIRNTVNFSPSQKRMITIYNNELLGEGLIEKQNGVYIAKAKFIPNKKIKKYARKGAPRINGYFHTGATLHDKVDKKGRVITDGFIKEFIEIDYFQSIEYEGEEREQYIFDQTTKAFQNIKLKSTDYFTIILQGGWEIGQNMRAKTKLKDRHHGTKYAEDQETHNLKIREITEWITTYLNTSIIKYKIAEELILGLNWYKFRKQRQPTNKELKAMK